MLFPNYFPRQSNVFSTQLGMN